MGYWGWRRALAVCLSVWVVGCSTTHDITPTAPSAARPSITLTMRAAQPTTAPPTLTAEIPTPVPAPTAAVYTIQPGDTLLGIALQFGVELDALQAANGNLNPLALPIGREILIVRPSFSSEGKPALPTATPAAIQADAPGCWPTPADGIICLGLIHNPLKDPVGRVTLLGRLIRPDGSVLAEAFAGLEQGIIPPGQTAPYRLQFQADWDEYGGAAVSILSADRTVARTIALDIAEETISRQDGQYIVHARLRNPGDQPARLLRAIMTLRDAGGHVTGYRVLPLERELAGGSDFTLEIRAASHLVATSHDLFVEAEQTN